MKLIKIMKNVKTVLDGVAGPQCFEEIGKPKKQCVLDWRSKLSLKMDLSGQFTKNIKPI